jgi:hypothetical protein
VPGDEAGPRRAAGIEALELDLGDEDVRGTVKVDQVAPPAAAGTRDLRGIYQQRIDPHAADADIIDRALVGAELCPGALPAVAKLDPRRGAAGNQDGQDQHRDRPADFAAFDAEEWRGAGAVELDAEICDVAGGADLLALHVDRADDLVERRIGQVGRLGGRALVGRRPQFLESLALRHPPAGIARRHRILAADVNANAADLERARAVDRQDSALAGLELGANRHARASDHG